ncbi:NAD(P)/FAD-dependent oxidoreductase [Streptomyces sp. PBH53]|uniref:NAD(P)/FAD-dependent oxidoreductase n=1 Tax=Streptomyces sp. PBH53 TaxID=1577075 RepID=UPI000A81E375|nr:FAD-binding oxidoreductase [Streptomyces sp. PBH53]
MNSHLTPWATSQEATRPRLRGRRRCDVAVVGAGLTGLSTALELLTLNPESRVVVLEADRVAAGASGRGTGLLGPRIGPALQVARRRFGDDVARAAHLWSVAAVRHVLDLVERHQLACDLTPGGQLVVARDERAAEHQHQERQAALMLGLPPEHVEFVERDQLPPYAGRGLSGLRYGPAATLDPAALTEQLARAGERLGLVIHENSQVRRIRRGLLNTVVTDGGELVADHVVLAVNAYGGSLAAAPSGVLPVRVQAGVTHKLSEEQLAELAGLDTEPLIEHGEVAPYFRLTPDGRLVVGGGALERGAHGCFAPHPGRLLAAARAFSPALADISLDAAWAGPIAVTRDGLPVLGEHRGDPWLHHATGCNGHGLALSVYHGGVLARRIAGADTGPSDLPWLRASAPWLPRGRVTDRVLDRYLEHLATAAAPSGSAQAAAEAGGPAPRTEIPS